MCYASLSTYPYSIVKEASGVDALKTEEERQEGKRLLRLRDADSFRPQVHHRDLVLIRGERAP